MSSGTEFRRRAKTLLRRIFPTEEEACLRRLRARRLDPGRPETVLPGGLRLAGLTPLEAYNEYKDVFRHRIYAFHPRRPAPRILDGGAYVGLTSLWFHRTYPGARITAFECDPSVCGTLRGNLRLNGAGDVEVVQAALAGEEGERAFHASGGDSGSLVAAPAAGAAITKVRTARLSSWLGEEVDFLKLNIEGAELEVLAEAESRLGMVREMVLEYHSFAGQEQVLGELLLILKRAGFRMLVNHADYESNLAARPPFRLGRETWYILLVYACREEALG